MILRRFSASMKKRDWSVITIELVVVVAGVFIGLQASNWNEERAHRSEERAFLLQLGEEMDGIAEAIDHQTRYVSEVVASGRRCAENLRSPDAAAMLHEIRADAALTPALQFWLGQNICALAYYPEMHKRAAVAKAAIMDDVGDGE